MKVLTCLLSILSFSGPFAQNGQIDSLGNKVLNTNIDSLQIIVKKSKQDTNKAILLGDISLKYAFSVPERGLEYGRQGFTLSKNLGYEYGAAYNNQGIAMCFWALSNYQDALEYTLKSIKSFEELKDKERLGFSYIILGNVYRDIGDFQRALAASLYAQKLYYEININSSVANAFTGSVYILRNQLDSALMYVQKAYEQDVVHNNGTWGWPLILLGNIHAKKKHYDIALAYYRMALPLVIENEFKKDVVDIYNSMTELYREINKEDSAIFYSSEVLHKWRSTSYQKGVLQAARTLADIYLHKGSKDSTIKYLHFSTQLNEKLYNQDKERAIQAMAFNEQLRQQELGTMKEKKDRERRENIQFAGIAVGLVSFIVIFLLLSRKIITSTRVIKFLGVVALLMIFEFVNLLLHPFLGSITRYSPLLMLLAMVVLAAILVPIHHQLEKKTIQWLIEKNKRLRLEEAKRTISELEPVTMPE